MNRGSIIPEKALLGKKPEGGGGGAQGLGDQVSPSGVRYLLKQSWKRRMSIDRSHSKG